MINILVTRSRKENRDFIKRAKNPNIKYHQINLIRYNLVKDFDFKEIQEYDNIILSSKFSSRILTRHKDLKGKNFWIVGKESKRILLQKKFNNLQDYSSIEELFKNIPQNEQCNKTIYISGETYTMKPPEKITHRYLYQTRYRQKLTKYSLNIFQNQLLDKVILYSNNSAQTFFLLMKKYNLLDKFTDTEFITLSDKISMIVRAYLPTAKMRVLQSQEMYSYLEKLTMKQYN